MRVLFAVVGIAAALGLMAFLLLREGAGGDPAVPGARGAGAAEPEAVELEQPPALPAEPGADPAGARAAETAPPPPPPRGLEDGERPVQLERP